MFADEVAQDESVLARLDLPDDTTAPGLARAHTRRVLGGWSLLGMVEPLVLVVSELVSNAVRYGRPPIELLLRRVGGGVRVDVHDARPGYGPADRDWVLSAGDDETGGRGLPLVEAVSVEHGVDQIADDGKRVWAVIEPELPQTL